MLSITPTKLFDYLTCPLKFKLRHLSRSHHRESSPALSFGISIHRALQEIHNQGLSRQKFSHPVTIDVEKLLKRFWEKSSYTDEKEETEYFAKGCRALENYCKTAAKERTETLGTEVYMSFLIASKDLKMRLGCKADRVAVQQNRLEIIDYKTNHSGQVPAVEFLETHLPTFMYHILARLTYPQYTDITLTFLNVLTNARTSIQYDKRLVDENKRKLWECLKTIAAADYQPRMSEACSWCSFQDTCPAMGKIVDFQTI